MYHRCSAWLAVSFLAVLLDPAHSLGADVPPARILRRAPPTSRASCGVDCLYVSLRAVGKDTVALAVLEQGLPAGVKGISIADIQKNAEDKGVHVTLLKTDLAGLANLRNPMILHVNDSHFVTYLGQEDEKLILFDNAIGLYECTPEWFNLRYQWDDVAILFGPPPPRVVLSLYGLPFAVIACGVGGLGILWVAWRKPARSANVAPPEAPSSLTAIYSQRSQS